MDPVLQELLSDPSLVDVPLYIEGNYVKALFNALCDNKICHIGKGCYVTIYSSMNFISKLQKLLQPYPRDITSTLYRYKNIVIKTYYINCGNNTNYDILNKTFTYYVCNSKLIIHEDDIANKTLKLSNKNILDLSTSNSYLRELLISKFMENSWNIITNNDKPHYITINNLKADSFWFLSSNSWIFDIHYTNNDEVYTFDTDELKWVNKNTRLPTTK